jgi:orotate phosphoribosyltransferase
MTPLRREMVVADKVARLLLETNAVSINTEDLFQFVSGILAPIYVDNRRLIAFPRARREIVGLFVDILREDPGVHRFDLVCGVATGGIPWAAWIAQEMDIPMAYVRSEAKNRGKKRQVEGALQTGQSAVIIEDTVSTGSSTVNAIEAMRNVGALVSRSLAIFSFGAPATAERFGELGVKPSALTQLGTLLSIARGIGYISPPQSEAIKRWARETWTSPLD